MSTGLVLVTSASMRLAPCPLMMAPVTPAVYGIAIPPAVAPCEWPQNASGPTLISACVGDAAAGRSNPVANLTSDS